MAWLACCSSSRQLLDLLDFFLSANCHVRILFVATRASEPFRLAVSALLPPGAIPLPLLRRRGVDCNARAHRGAQIAALDVLALGHRRLRLDDAGDHGCCVVHQLVRRKRNLAHRHVDQRRLVGAELNLAGLGFLHCRRYIEGHRARLRIRHQPARAKHLAQAAHRLHHVGRGDHGVVVGPVFLLDLLHHVLAAHEVSACCFGFANLLAGGDDQNLLRLAQPVRAELRFRAPSGRRAWDRLPGAS